MQGGCIRTATRGLEKWHIGRTTAISVPEFPTHKFPTHKFPTHKFPFPFSSFPGSSPNALIAAAPGGGDGGGGVGGGGGGGGDIGMRVGGCSRARADASVLLSRVHVRA